MLNKVIITFRDNSNHHIVSPTQVSQYWANLKGVIVPESKLEIAIPIGVFLVMKEDRVFQSKFVDVVRLRTSERDILGYMCYPINPFDNTIDDAKLQSIIETKYN